MNTDSIFYIEYTIYAINRFWMICVCILYINNHAHVVTTKRILQLTPYNRTIRAIL